MFLSWWKNTRALSLSEKGQLVKILLMQRDIASKKYSKYFQLNAFYSNQDDDCKYFAKQDCSFFAFCLPTFAICFQFKFINILRLFISLPFYLVSSSSLSSSTLERRFCMCLQLYLIFLLRSPTSSQPSLSLNDFVLVLCGRWFIYILSIISYFRWDSYLHHHHHQLLRIVCNFAILFDISVVIPIIITIIMNIGRCLQIYLNVLLWSTSFSIFGKLFICGHFIFLLSSISLSQSTINQTSLQVICFCRTLSKINIIITELRCYIIKLYSSFFCSLASSL